MIGSMFAVDLEDEADQLQIGETIDLGGAKIEVSVGPGHTARSDESLLVVHHTGLAPVLREPGASHSISLPPAGSSRSPSRANGILPGRWTGSPNW